jgi:hypothetical protein
MSNTLAQARTFAFETSERIEIAIPGPEKKRVLNCDRKVVVRRPDGLFFELRSKDDPALSLTSYYDGRNLVVSDGPAKLWAQTTVPADLDGMLDDVSRRFGLPVPIADVVYSSPADAFIGKTTTGGFTGRETIEGVSCVALRYEDASVGVALWVPESGKPLLRRLELTYKRVPSVPVTRIDFKSWQLDLPVAGPMFVFTPSVGDGEVDFGALVSALTSGAPLPAARTVGKVPAR